VAHNDFVEKPEGNGELWKLMYRWEDNITQDLKESRRKNVSYKCPIVVKEAVNQQVQYNVGNFLNSRETLRYSRIT
jgi:hypothetical protein